MEQRHTFEPTEPVSNEEMRQILERFREGPTAKSDQPTVRDVAETLQVEPDTIGQILAELRAAKDKAEVKERLDRLERENAELRVRSDYWEMRRKRKLVAAFTAATACAVAAVSSASSRGGPTSWLVMSAGVMAILALVMFRLQSLKTK